MLSGVIPKSDKIIARRVEPSKHPTAIAAQKERETTLFTTGKSGSKMGGESEWVFLFREGLISWCWRGFHLTVLGQGHFEKSVHIKLHIALQYTLRALGNGRRQLLVTTIFQIHAPPRSRSSWCRTSPFIDGFKRDLLNPTTDIVVSAVVFQTVEFGKSYYPFVRLTYHVQLYIVHIYGTMFFPRRWISNSILYWRCIHPWRTHGGYQLIGSAAINYRHGRAIAVYTPTSTFGTAG